jgi:hypothetical protein
MEGRGSETIVEIKAKRPFRPPDRVEDPVPHNLAAAGNPAVNNFRYVNRHPYPDNMVARGA